MRDARRDALAHRFIAQVVDETRRWPPRLQLALHELAMTALPELVLELRGERARTWARDWRERMEGDLAPAAGIAAEDAAWVAELAGRGAASPADEPDADPVGLGELLERLGPIALALPWRRTPPARA